jgi:hypothetical protein
MTDELKLPLATAAVVIVPATIAYGLTGGVFAVLTVAAAALLVVGYRRTIAEAASSQHGSRFFALFFSGSVAVGALYLSVITNVRPQPGPLNLVWMLGLPTAVGLLLRPRLTGLTLSLPLAITGWI